MLAAEGCTDGTFVDTAANPEVSGPNNDLVDDCRTLVQIQNYWAANPANDSLHIAHPLRTWGTATTREINTWTAVTVANSRVTQIDLSLSISSPATPPGIAGSIPTQIGNLTNLSVLSVGSNRLTSSIPTQIGNLANLRRLSLSFNRLSGSIPTQIGNLANLTYLFIGNNRLTGSIPTQIGNLAKLSQMYINSNLLSGSIPTHLGNLATSESGMLNNFSYCNNYLTGAIPAALRSGVTLSSEDYDPVGCQYTGTRTDTSVTSLPASGCTDGTFVDTEANPPVSGANNDLVEDCQTLVAIQNHWASGDTNNSLHAEHPLRTWGVGTTEKIDTWDGITVTYNRVTEVNLRRASTNGIYRGPSIDGTIPTQLGNLTSLTTLNFDRGELTGSIPAELGNLANLKILTLRSNRLVGSIPAELGNLANLTSLNVLFNYFSGSIPAELGNLASLEALNLRNNRLSGSIPAELGNLANLTFLGLDQNRLSGRIPAELGNLANLTRLQLRSNYFSGSIPAELGNLTNLDRLTLENNRLTGPIPSNLGNLAPSEGGNLDVLGICQNSLTGAVPTVLREGVTLSQYPTDEGYDPVACQRVGALWYTLTVQKGGTTAGQIRQALGLADSDAVFAWDAAAQTWQRSAIAQDIAAGTAVSFRTERQVENLEEARLGGTRQTALVSRWNILSAPAEIQRPGSMFTSQLISCRFNAGIIAVIIYSPATQEWSLWLPCHPRTQTRLTTGENPPYNSLTSISPQDTLYISARTSQPVDITWNSDASQYQPG